MTNDKRIILAIALYAAVIIMVLHTLDSEGHERFATAKESLEISSPCHTTTPLQLTRSLCTEISCSSASQEMLMTPSELSLCNEETGSFKHGEADERSDPS